MPTTAVVEDLDEVKERGPSVGMRAKGRTHEQLTFERREAAFRQGVVVPVPDRAHGGADPCRTAPVLKRLGGVLAAMIRVMNHAGSGAAMQERHVQDRHDEVGAQMRLHRPAHHAPTACVEDHGEEVKPLPGRHVGDVRDPHLIGSDGGKCPADEVRSAGTRGIPSRRDEPPPVTADHATQTHETGHALTRAAHAIPYACMARHRSPDSPRECLQRVSKRLQNSATAAAGSPPIRSPKPQVGSLTLADSLDGNSVPIGISPLPYCRRLRTCQMHPHAKRVTAILTANPVENDGRSWTPHVQNAGTLSTGIP